MTRILILGGSGMTGRLIARHLLAHTDAQVTIAARNVGRAQAFADLLNDRYAYRRSNAVQVEASDPESLRAAFTGHDLVVVSAPTSAQAGSVARAALDCGLDYLDVQRSPHKVALLQSLQEEIARAGRCFVTEAGFHPGLPSAIVRYAAASLDQVERAVAAGYLNMGRFMPYTEAADEVVERLLRYSGQIFQDGKWTAPDQSASLRFDFGGEIGLRPCHSMFLEELRALPDRFPSLKSVGFFMADSHWFNEWIVLPFVWTWLRINPLAVRPAGKLIWWSMARFTKSPYMASLHVQAEGKANGQPARFKASIEHINGYELTAIPAAAALMQLLDGSIRRPGLWLMGHAVDPARLLQDMQGMGAQVRSSLELHQPAGMPAASPV